MILMTLLACLLLQRYLGVGKLLHNTSWLDNYVRGVYSTFHKHFSLSGITAVILLILPLILAIGVIQFFLKNWFFGLFGFLFSLLILLFCLDTHDLRGQLKQYFSAYQAGDYQAAYHHGLEFAADSDATDLPNLIRTITCALLLHAAHYIFAVLFWYILLGPAGAMLYFVVSYLLLHAEQPESYLSSLADATKRLQILLDWFPSRLVGITYALAGHFEHAFAHWYQHINKHTHGTQTFVVNTGLIALECDEIAVSNVKIDENYQALALIDRALLIWIVIVAIFTLGAWLA